jgi:hypothetical protein
MSKISTQVLEDKISYTEVEPSLDYAFQLLKTMLETKEFKETV